MVLALMQLLRRSGHRGLAPRRRAAVLAGVNLDLTAPQQYPDEASGGMKQRVCIAITILLGPKVIIADEPTGALDGVTERLVMQTVRQQQERIAAALIGSIPKPRQHGVLGRIPGDLGFRPGRSGGSSRDRLLSQVIRRWRRSVHRSSFVLILFSRVIVRIPHERHHQDSTASKGQNRRS